MNCLVIGAGFLGKKLITVFSSKGNNVEATAHEQSLFRQLDVADEKATGDFIGSLSPDLVLLCASVTKVDLCEQNPELASRVHVDGAKNVVNALQQLSNPKLVFYSSDFVFDGKRGNYSEQDAPHPINVYGKTKLEAEKIVSSYGNHLILRTSTLYGFNKTESVSETSKIPFVEWAVRELGQGNEVKAVTDQVTNPTLIDDLANATLKLVEKNAVGLYHAVGPEKASRHGFSEKIAKVFGFDPGLVKEATSADISQLAKRPCNSTLSTAKLNAQGIEMRGIEAGLKEMKRQMEGFQ